MERVVIAGVIGTVGALMGAGLGIHFEEAGLILAMIGAVMGIVVGAYLTKFV